MSDKRLIEMVTDAIAAAENDWWESETEPELGLIEALAIAAIKAMDAWRFEAAGITSSPAQNQILEG